MVKKISLFLFFILFSSFSFAFSQQDLVDLLQKQQNIQGHFTQQRFLKSLSHPITTQGKFTLLAKKGLLWRMEKPFAVDLRVKQTGIMQWDGNNWIANNQLGQSQHINLFLSLLGGDISALKEQFNLKLSGSQESWNLLLTPDSILMKQIFERIVIIGDKTVKEINLIEKQGDTTRIVFSHIQIDQALDGFALSALE